MCEYLWAYTVRFRLDLLRYYSLSNPKSAMLTAMDVQLQVILPVQCVQLGSTSSKARIPAWMRAQTKVRRTTLTEAPARPVTESARPAAALRLTTAILARLELLR